MPSGNLIKSRMKPLQHAQISAKTHGGIWSDYIEIHNFLDSSKAACAHFKHRFLLHHREGISLGGRIFGANLLNSEGKVIETERLLTEHLIEDLGKVVSVEDWARDLLPETRNSFYQFLQKKRKQIESDGISGETRLFDSFNLSEKDRVAVKEFLAFPLKNSTHPAAVLFSHNSFAIYLAEKILGYAFVKDTKNRQEQYISVREILERVIFQRMKIIFSPAEIIARTASREWMRGADAGKAQEEKKRLALI